MISKNRTGAVVGLVFGLCHLVWAVLVAVGMAQGLMDWIFRLHFIQPPYVVTQFNLVLAVGLILVTTAIGYVTGWVFGAIWNWLHPKLYS